MGSSSVMSMDGIKNTRGRSNNGRDRMRSSSVSDSGPRRSSDNSSHVGILRSHSLPSLRVSRDNQEHYYYYCYTRDLQRRLIKSILKSRDAQLDHTTGSTFRSDYSTRSKIDIEVEYDMIDPTSSAFGSPLSMGEKESAVNGPGSSSANCSKSIEFSHIHIREYARTIGDNPSCSSGPPISISWEYNPNTRVLTVEEYEKSRGPRRTNLEMVIPRMERQRMLRRDWDVSHQEIIASIRSKVRIRNQRRTTVMRLGRSDKFEECMELAVRKVLILLALRPRVSRQAAELDRIYDQVQAARRQLFSEEFLSEKDDSCFLHDTHTLPTGAQQADRDLLSDTIPDGSDPKRNLKKVNSFKKQASIRSNPIVVEENDDLHGIASDQAQASLSRESLEVALKQVPVYSPSVSSDIDGAADIVLNEPGQVTTEKLSPSNQVILPEKKSYSLNTQENAKNVTAFLNKIPSLETYLPENEKSFPNMETLASSNTKTNSSLSRPSSSPTLTSTIPESSVRIKEKTKMHFTLGNPINRVTVEL